MELSTATPARDVPVWPSVLTPLSPLLPDCESPFALWLSVKWEQLQQRAAPPRLRGPSALPHGHMQTSLLLPHHPSLGSPGATCSWVL